MRAEIQKKESGLGGGKKFFEGRKTENRETGVRVRGKAEVRD